MTHNAWNNKDMRSSMRISASYLRGMRKNCMSWGAELTFFFSDARRSGRLLKGSARGRRVRKTSCAYSCSRPPWPCNCQHTFVEASIDVWFLYKKNRVSLFLNDKEEKNWECAWRIKNEDFTLISSGIRMARRKRPKRSSWIGTVSLGARLLFTDVSWGKASDCCVVLYVGRLSPERTRCPFEICNEISFVFIPGTSKTAVRMDSAGLSIKSILWIKVSRGAKKCEYSDVPWSVFGRGRWWRCDSS